MNKLYQEEALEKKRNRKPNAPSTKLINTPIKLGIYTSIFISISLLVWSIYARIPLRATGIGIFLPNEELRPVKSMIEGRVIFLFNDGTLKSPPYDKELFEFNRSDIYNITDQQIFSTMNKLRDLQHLYISKKNMYGSSHYPEGEIPAGSIVAIIKPNNIKAYDLEEKLINYKNLINFNNKAIKSEQIILNSNKEIFASKSKIMNKMKELEKKSFVSTNSVLNYQSELNSTQNQVQGSKLNIIQKLDEIEEARNELIENTKGVLNDIIIFANYKQFILEMNTSNFTYQRPGSTLMTVSRKPLHNPKIIPVFFSNSESIKIGRGMKALITPMGLNRSAVGGIKGQIKTIEKLPATIEYVENQIGLKGGASLISNEIKNPTVGTIILSNKKIPPYEYEWSSGAPPVIQSLNGDLANVEVTTGYTRPIALVIPFLREFFGIVPPNNKREKNADNSQTNRSN